MVREALLVSEGERVRVWLSEEVTVTVVTVTVDRVVVGVTVIIPVLLKVTVLLWVNETVWAAVAVVVPEPVRVLYSVSVDVSEKDGVTDGVTEGVIEADKDAVL